MILGHEDTGVRKGMKERKGRKALVQGLPREPCVHQEAALGRQNSLLHLSVLLLQAWIRQ